MTEVVAAVTRGGGPFRVEPAELDDPRPDEVLVRINAVGVCHTDLTHRHLTGPGPAVLGHERFREQQDRSSFGLVQDMVRAVLETSTYDLSEEMLETFSRIFFGAMSAAGETVSAASDPKRAVAQVEIAIGFILAGMRSLTESGVALPDPEDLLSGR